MQWHCGGVAHDDGGGGDKTMAGSARNWKDNLNIVRSCNATHAEQSGGKTYSQSVRSVRSVQGAIWFQLAKLPYLTGWVNTLYLVSVFSNRCGCSRVGRIHSTSLNGCENLASGYADLLLNMSRRACVGAAGRTFQN